MAIVLRGVCAILFGLGAFVWPAITLAVLVLLYGAYAFVDGILAVMWSFVNRRSGAFPWGVFVAGLAGIVAGVVTFAWPAVTAIARLYFIAAWAIVRGIFEIVAAIHLRKELDNEWLLGLSGALSVLLGIVLIVAPGAGALALLWWIGAFAVVFGVLMVILGLRLKGLRNGPVRRPLPGRWIRVSVADA